MIRSSVPVTQRVGFRDLIQYPQYWWWVCHQRLCPEPWNEGQTLEWESQGTSHSPWAHEDQAGRKVQVSSYRSSANARGKWSLWWVRRVRRKVVLGMVARTNMSLSAPSTLSCNRDVQTFLMPSLSLLGAGLFIQIIPHPSWLPQSINQNQSNLNQSNQKWYFPSTLEFAFWRYEPGEILLWEHLSPWEKKKPIWTEESSQAVRCCVHPSGLTYMAQTHEHSTTCWPWCTLHYMWKTMSVSC